MISGVTAVVVDDDDDDDANLFLGNIHFYFFWSVCR